MNALLPGRTDTPMVERITRNVTALAGPRIRPIDRAATPAELPANAVWLLSDHAAYITGSCVLVEGGMAIA